MDDEVVPDQLIYETCTQVMSYTFMDLTVGFLFPFKKLYLCTMERNKEQPHEESKGSFFRAFDSKRVSHCYLHLGRDTKAGRGVGKLWKKRSSTCALSGEYRCGESVGSFINSTVIDRVHIWFFWLALTWKWDKKLGKLSVINRAFDIWGLFLQKQLLGFLYCYPSEHSIFYKTDL